MSCVAKWLAFWRCLGECHSWGCHGYALLLAAVLHVCSTSLPGTSPLVSLTHTDFMYFLYCLLCKAKRKLAEITLKHLTQNYRARQSSIENEDPQRKDWRLKTPSKTKTTSKMKTPSKTNTYSKMKAHLKSIMFDCLFKTWYESIRFWRGYSFSILPLIQCHANFVLENSFLNIFLAYYNLFLTIFFPTFCPTFSSNCFSMFFLTFFPTFFSTFCWLFSWFFPPLITYIKGSFLSWSAKTWPGLILNWLWLFFIYCWGELKLHNTVTHFQQWIK